MARMQGLTLARGNRGLLFIAVLAGLAAAVLFIVAVNKDDSTGGSGAPTGVTTVKTVVAAQSIAAGTEITADMVKVVDVSEELAVAGAFSDTLPVVGEVTNVAIAANEPITATKIGELVEGQGLEYVVPDGMRAVSLEVREVTAVGGLLLPGNHVDIIGTFKIRGVPGLADNEFILSTRTILQNVEVLSVATQNLEPLPAGNDADGDGLPDTLNSGSLPEDVEEQPRAATVTLALNPQQVMELISAQESAQSVWSSLRPAGESAPVELGNYDVVMTD